MEEDTTTDTAPTTGTTEKPPEAVIQVEAVELSGPEFDESQASEVVGSEGSSDVMGQRVDLQTYAGDVNELCQNTPTKAKQNSLVWQCIRRLPEHLRNDYPRKTHVCTARNEDGTVCLRTLRLSKTKVSAANGTGTWQTALANQHLRHSHVDTSYAGSASAKRKNDASECREQSMFACGMNAERQMDGDLAKYILTKEEKALTSQARWYIYSHMRISKQEFESEEFREMLRGQSDGPGIFLSENANSSNGFGLNFAYFSPSSSSPYVLSTCKRKATRSPRHSTTVEL